MRCIRHGKRGRPLAAPSHPRLPPPATYARSLVGNSGQSGQSIGFERADELHAVQCLVGGGIPTVWIKIVRALKLPVSRFLMPRPLSRCSKKEPRGTQGSSARA